MNRVINGPWKLVATLLLLAALACSALPGGDLSATQTAVAIRVMTQVAQTQAANIPVQTPEVVSATPPQPPGGATPPAGGPIPPPGGEARSVSLQLSITGRYLMALHACEMAECQQGPRAHQVYLAQSDDGQAWNLVPGWEPFSGSVPDVIRRGNRLYLFTPGRMARYNLDTQLFEGPQEIFIDGLAEGFVDPSLTVDEQGRLVVFFLYGRLGSDPAGCPPGESTCTQRFGSATEVEGSDGAQFTLDDGDRVSVQISPNSAVRGASDPDIFFDGEQYVLYISHGPSISVWTSPELRGEYAQVTALLANNYGVPSGYFDSQSQRYWSFAHRAWQDRPTSIYRAVHADLSRRLGQEDWAVVVSGESLGLGANHNVESPGFAVNEP